MATKKKTNDEVKAVTDEVEVVKETAEKTIVFQATRSMTFEEHMELSKRLRYEQEQSGVKVVLLPYSGKVGE